MRSWFVGCVSFCLFSFCPLSLSEVSIDFESDKKLGTFFYMLHRNDEAIPLLEVAARAGDAQSQYFLGDIERRKHFGIVTDEGRSWFEQAANQGHSYAMLALTGRDIALCTLIKNCGPEHKTPEQWKAKALDVSEKKANAGDGEAMLLMYYLTSDLNWLSRSAESGCVDAKYRLGQEYRNGAGFFLTPNGRQLAADEWIIRAAKDGHLLAITMLLK